MFRANYLASHASKAELRHLQNALLQCHACAPLRDRPFWVLRLREQLELQKKQLEQQRKMQAELREQLQQQQQVLGEDAIMIRSASF